MGRKYILVVDDEEVIRIGLQRILEGDRFAVMTCKCGHSAIELLKKWEFDLIITDLKMQGMNGIEILKAVKTLQPDVSVIIISGSGTVYFAEEAMKSGAVDILSKPFSPEELLVKIERALQLRYLPID